MLHAKMRQWIDTVVYTEYAERVRQSRIIDKLTQEEKQVSAKQENAEQIAMNNIWDRDSSTSDDALRNCRLNKYETCNNFDTIENQFGIGKTDNTVE